MANKCHRFAIEAATERRVRSRRARGSRADEGKVHLVFQALAVVDPDCQWRDNWWGPGECSELSPWLYSVRVAAAGRGFEFY